MKKLSIFLKSLEWKFDYYIAYFLYNPKKVDRYHSYMKNKYQGTNKTAQVNGS